MGVAEVALLVAVMVASASGQFFLKLGANQLSPAQALPLLQMFTSPWLIVGLGFYGLGAISYISLLSRLPLSIVAPATAASYILSVLIGAIAFREVIPFTRWLGLALIIIGVLLVVWKR